MTKGSRKRELILQSALDFTSKFGLESLSIGELAKTVGMSKSGLFGHFKSKETLQIMVLDYAANDFINQVIIPATKKPRGLARLDNMMDNWRHWTQKKMQGGCPFVSSIVEFDDRPGKIRDHVLKLQTEMIGSFERALLLSKEEGEIHADSDIKQVAFEIYGTMISFHIYSRLLKNKASEEMFLVSYQKIIAGIKTDVMEAL